MPSLPPNHFPELVGPSISTITPTAGPRGTIVTITGENLSPARLDNTVTVGGATAFVLSASPTELTALTGADTETGPVKVTVGGLAAASGVDFSITGYPAAGDDTTDGPPVVTVGVADGPSAGDVSPIGTIRVLVVMLQANDRMPANATTTATQVNTAWANVHTYYDQVSYTRTNVQIDQTAFVTLDGAFNDFMDTVGENYQGSQLDRIAAIGVDGAGKQGFNINNYPMICFMVFTNGTFVRAWGGGSQSTFAYDNGKPAGAPDRISINITANHPINTLFINESADWGRFAHEFGHNVVSAPTSTGDGTATLGEDVYGSDLVDPSAATAQSFELMGDHDAHPIFTGFHLEKLGYYQPANIKTLTWDRNPHSERVDIVAHGLSQDADPNRIHIAKVAISDALSYYIEVRQRPGATAQIFDDQIPFGASADQGGIVITRVIAGEMHNNQQTRFITLMHANRVLLGGEFAEDPARALRITVENDSVQARPLVCRVRVEWAQTVVDDPRGSFDLRIEPWDSTYQTPDIWVDRDPFGMFDQALDSQGRPLSNGDRPRVGSVNHVIARVHVSGAMGATDVKVTHYAVTPPGVGDNGNWSPIAVNTVASIATNSFADVSCNWVPVVGRHTCLRAFAAAQFGEISGHNNSAQENVSDFIAAGGSPCEPVIVRTAIRNPVDDRKAVRLSLHGVPKGWMAWLPYSWVWLDGKAEKEVDVAIWPTADVSDYKIGATSKDDGDGRLPGMAPVRILGAIERRYDVSVLIDGKRAATRLFPIGGVFYRVHVRRKSSIQVEVGRHDSEKLVWTVYAFVSPAVGDQRVVVDVTDPAGKQVLTLVGVSASNGRVQVTLDLNDTVRERGSGAYAIQAFIFDADKLDDAASNIVLITA